MDELNKQSNAFDYLIWRGDLGFKENKINEIDIAILTQIAILDLKGIVPEIDEDNSISIYDAYEAFHKEERDKKKIGLIIPNTIIRAFNKIHKTHRFKHIEAMHYLEDISLEDEMQISATTFKITDDEYVICFSGTDDTIIGWKENFNMMYKFPVPAQVCACDYVNKVVKKHEGAKFYISGHSKGGNMAIYSTYTCEEDVFKRIIATYNYDGPGLSTKDENFFDDTRTKKILSIVPQSSVVGVLFDHKEKITYVRSIQNGAYQHDVFSWLVKGCDFVYEKDLTKEGRAIRDKTKEVISEMSDVEKEKFSNNLYLLLSAGDSYNLLDANEKKKYFWDAYFKMPKEEKKYLLSPLRKLFKDRDVQKTVFDTFRGMINDTMNAKKIEKEEKNKLKKS